MDEINNQFSVDMTRKHLNDAQLFELIKTT